MHRIVTGRVFTGADLVLPSILEDGTMAFAVARVLEGTAPGRPAVAAMVLRGIFMIFLRDGGGGEGGCR